MENLKINKRYFVDDEPSDKVRKSIRSKVEGHSIKKSLFARFRYRYVAVPVFLFMIFWSYMVLTPSPLDKEISQTQSAMNQLITLADTEVF
jgi:hypothetical protein